MSRVHWEKWLGSNFVVGTAHHHRHNNNNNNNKTCTLIDVAIPADRNVV